MKQSTYEELLEHLVLPFDRQPHHEALERMFGVSKHTLGSIYFQESQKRVIQRHTLLKQAIGAICQRYRNGEDIIDLSYELDFPPCIVMRRLLEVLPLSIGRQQITKALRDPSTLFLLLPQEILDEQRQHHARQHDNNSPTTQPSPTPCTPPSSSTSPTTTTNNNNNTPSITDMYLDLEQCLPHLSPQHQDTVAMFLRLHDDVKRCVDGDQMYAPSRDASRHEAGMVHEVQLYEQLDKLGVAFLTEDMLRAKGFFKTPDVKLLVPIAIHGRIVHWIDSKACFGDEYIHHTQYKEQYTKYINRYGPGAVVYWFDYLEDLQQHDDLLLLHGLPGTDAITVLPQLPISLVNIPTAVKADAVQGVVVDEGKKAVAV